jgi:formiminotetrahydrofolate cyclodeaminase
VPARVAMQAFSLWPLLKKLAPIVNINTKSDLLVGVKCLETGIYAAYVNVLTNMESYNEVNEKHIKLNFDIKQMWSDTLKYSEEVLKILDNRS